MFTSKQSSKTLRLKMQICSSVEAKLCRNLLFELRQAPHVGRDSFSDVWIYHKNSFRFNMYRGSGYTHCDRLHSLLTPSANAAGL